MDIRLPETALPVLEWARGLPPRQRVGRPNDCHECVLANWLRMQGAPDPSMIGPEYVLDKETDALWLPSPVWAFWLSVATDELEDEVKFITAGRVVRILESLS